MSNPTVVRLLKGDLGKAQHRGQKGTAREIQKDLRKAEQTFHKSLTKLSKKRNGSAKRRRSRHVKVMAPPPEPAENLPTYEEVRLS